MTNKQKARGFINRLVELDIINDSEQDIEIAINGLTQLLDYVQHATVREIEALENLDIHNY